MDLDDTHPSLFELLSTSQLEALIPPSLRYLLAVATHRHPRYLLRVLNSFDELYALGQILVERHFLRVYGGSFTENFYGLKRERVVLVPHGDTNLARRGAEGLVREATKLRDKDIWRNILVLVGIPYIKRKLDEHYEINAPRALLGAAYNRLPANPTLKERVIYAYRWFLRRVYPSVNAAYYFALLVFNLRYLFGGSKTHDPFLWLIGTRVRRMGQADYHAIEAVKQVSLRAAGVGGGLGGEGGRPGTTSLFHPRVLVPKVLGGLRFVLPASIFALKFLEWWHASDFARQLGRKAAEGLVLPPPVVSGVTLGRSGAAVEKRAANEEKEAKEEEEPQDPPIAATTLLPIFTVSARDDGVCPICGKEIVTPTAAPTGFVFCYVCVHRWVKGEHDRQEAFMKGREGRWESGEGRCPVTGRRVLGGTEGLRRVMI